MKNTKCKRKLEHWRCMHVQPLQRHGRVYFTAHLVAKQAMDEVDLISRVAWFGGNPEIKVADSCIQLLFKCQIL